MNHLTELAALGNFVSGIAVVFTLMFLILQSRQTHRNQRSIIQQARTTCLADSMLRCTDPYLSDAMVRGFAGDTTMEPAQIHAFIRQLAALICNYEDSYLQHRAGTLHRSSWASDEASIREYANYAGFASPGDSTVTS